MEKILDELFQVAADLGMKLVACLLAYFIGNFIIKKILNGLKKSRILKETEGTVQTFTVSFVKIALYIVLVIIIVGIIGVPMASVITVLASAGVAIGMAMQGALGNIASGIVLMIFKPFHLGDYISTDKVEGYVTELNLFYTVLVTFDNRKITVPNATMMNVEITDHTSEKIRRVDLSVTCDRDESLSEVIEILMEEAVHTKRVLKDPEPFVGVTDMNERAIEISVRVWCEPADYWDVYYDLLEGLARQMEMHGIKAPAVRIQNAAAPEIRS